MPSDHLLYGKYKAAFLLPIGASKTLNNDGWIFADSRRLSSDVLDFLVKSLGLVFAESYLGMDRFACESLQATVVRDDSGDIEHVDFQVYDDARDKLEKAFSVSDLVSSCELFFPD